MKGNVCLLIGVLAVCLLAGLISIYWKQAPQKISPMAVYDQERQRQSTLDKKLQDLVKLIVEGTDRTEERLRREKYALGIRDFIFNAWSNRTDRAQAILKMENALYNIDTEASLSQKGMSPVMRIYSLANDHPVNGFLYWLDNSQVEIWKMQIRALARVKKDRDLAIKLYAAAPEQSEKRRRLGDWVKYHKSTYDFWLRNHEGHFNSDVEDRHLPVDQEQEVRAYFEHYLGRPIRTAKQIREDFERCRIKSPTDDDMKINIDL